jgi:IclR family mhp operon transcriptional activator
METGKPIRSISRCISVLRAINQSGPLSMTEISQQARVPYATVCRIVQTLLHEGLIEREPSRPKYRPTALVQALSQGFQAHDRLVAIARPHIVRLTSRLLWPVAVTTRVGQEMVVRDSTHSLTSMTFNNYHCGYTLPIMGSAAGRAYLAFAPEEERRMMLASLRGTRQYETDDMAHMIASGSLLETIRSNGYATKLRNEYTETPGKTSSLAAPVFENGVLVGVLIMSYFTSAMRMSEAEAQLAPSLRQAAEAIQLDLLGVANDEGVTKVAKVG